MKHNNRPEEEMYKDFIQEFELRFPKYLDRICRFEHGGYKIGFAEQRTRKETLLRPGIPDYGFFVSSEAHTMLWVEFKCKGNKLSEKQVEMRSMFTRWGAKHVTCYSAQAGIEEINNYLIEE